MLSKLGLMSAEPTTRQMLAPPLAKQVPSVRTFHGDSVTDPYAWLAAKDDPDTIAFLEAENAYTEALTADAEGLRETIFAEIKGRTQETDLSVPVRKGAWWYYRRTVEGQQYGLQCRCPARPGDDTPPQPGEGQPLDGEEILLDANALAGDSSFFSLGAFSVSPDARWLAFSTDFSGDERFTLRIKDLETGAALPDEIPGTFYGAAWSLDGSALFYVTVDEAWRPWRVWRHTVGTPHTDDVVIFEEADERFWVGVGLTRSERFLSVSSSSKVTSEVWLLDAAAPAGELTRRGAAPPGRGVPGRAPGPRGRHRAAADPAQRRGAELRAGDGPGRSAGRVDAADPRAGGHPPAGRGRLHRLPGGPLPPGRPHRAADHPGRRQRARRRLPRAGLHRLPRRELRAFLRAVPAALRVAGDPGLGVRLRHGHR